MKLFVTGGTGFVGTHFLEQALAAGHDVIALRRPGSTPRLPLKNEPVWVDGALDENLSDPLQGCDALVHLASHTPNPPYAPLDECLYWNVYAPAKLAQQAITAGVSRFLIAGSCFEYGEASAELDVITTSTPLAPSLSYPTSKAAASLAFEGLAREHSLMLKILRIFQVFGPGEQASRLWPSLREAALRGDDFPMTMGEQVRDFIRVEDVASAFVEHLSFDGSEAGCPTVHHIASGHAQTLREFVEYWWESWGATGKLLLGARPYRQNEIMRLIPSV